MTPFRLEPSAPNHYATLGLDPRCTEEQIRAAYRVLAKQHHPDVNHGLPAAVARTQQLNAAYEVLSDPELRRAYDEARAAASQRPAAARSAAKSTGNISQEVHLRIEEFLRGTVLEVRVTDPANSSGPETYPLTVPPETVPGTRFRIARESAHGAVIVRVKMRPDFRFKARGSDLRCDLKIKSERAAQGGTEMIRGATGSMLRVQIPRGIARNEIVRIPGEGLPKPRGGRGDLLVRITYRVEVRITRSSRR